MTIRKMICSVKMKFNKPTLFVEGFYLIIVVISLNKPFIQHSQSSSVVAEVGGENIVNISSENSNSQALNDHSACSLEGNCNKQSLSQQATLTLARNNRTNQALNNLQLNHKFTQHDPTDKFGQEYIDRQQQRQKQYLQPNATTNLYRSDTGSDSYNKTIYSSLVKILHHMKQQLDKNNQIKARSEQDNDVDLNEFRESSNSRQQDDSHDLSQSVIFDDGPISTMVNHEPYTTTNELLSPFPSTTDTKVAGREHSAPRYATGFSSQLLGGPNNQSATSSFKPMAIIEVPIEPSQQYNGNYLTGTLTTNSLDNLRARKSTLSNQVYPSIATNNAVKSDRKSNFVASSDKQQLQNDQQMQQQLVSNSQQSPYGLDGSPSPQSWSLTDKSASLLPSENEVSVSEPLFDTSSPSNSNLNSFGPQYDLPMESNNGMKLLNDQNAEFKQGKLNDLSLTRGLIQIDQQGDENSLDTPPLSPLQIITKSRRSRRSKTSTKPPISISEKTSARFMRASDFNRNALSTSNEQIEDDGGNRMGKYANQFNEIQESTNLLPQTPRQDHTGVHLQQVYPMPFSGPQPQQRAHHQQQQQPIYTLSAAPSSLNLKSFVNSQSNNQMSSSIPSPSHDLPSASAASQQQRDLVNQPQTIQITAVPNVGVNQPLVRVNGQPLFSNLLNGGPYNNGFLDPFGRQVVMLNAERRQIDWSYWFWPILLAVTLPLVLGALFVPVFLKTIVMLIQVLQSLGLLLPLTNALTQQIAKASGVSANNQVEQVKT